MYKNMNPQRILFIQERLHLKRYFTIASYKLINKYNLKEKISSIKRIDLFNKYISKNVLGKIGTLAGIVTLYCLISIQFALAQKQEIHKELFTEKSLNLYISSQDAYRGYRIKLAPGLGVNISFVQMEEKIKRIWLDDLSEIVIDVDVALPEAQIIHLKRIQELAIPFQARSKQKNTSLTIITDKSIYQFIIELVDQNPYQTIHIIPQKEPILELDEKTIARLSHVERGLERAIQEKRLLPDSLLISKVREFVVSARRGKPIAIAAREQGLYLSFIYELARLGLKPPQFPIEQKREPLPNNFPENFPGN